MTKNIILAHLLLIVPTVAHGQIVGFVDGFDVKTRTITGWACMQRDSRPLKGRVVIKNTNLGDTDVDQQFMFEANRPSEPAVGQACADPAAAPHRFSYTIAAYVLDKIPGRPIHVYGFAVERFEVLLPGKSQIYSPPKGTYGLAEIQADASARLSTAAGASHQLYGDVNQEPVQAEIRRAPASKRGMPEMSDSSLPSAPIVVQSPAEEEGVINNYPTHLKGKGE